MFETEKVNSITDMWEKLSKESMPAGFTLIRMVCENNELTGEAGTSTTGFAITIRREKLDDILGMPVIQKNLTIYPNLSYRMHSDGVEISTRKVVHLTAQPGKLSTTSEVLNILAYLKAVTADSSDLRATAAQLLDRTSQENEDSIWAQFLAEQLRLANVPQKQRRYSTMLLCSAMVWDRTSPKLYDDLRSSGMLFLPHKVTLRRLTSALSVKEGLEVGTTTYLQMRIKKLNPREKIVNIAMDEAYTARAVELAGGRVLCDSKDGTTNTIFCLHISSIAGRYEDMVAMVPVPHITTQDIKDIFFKVLRQLTDIGFTVVSVTTDGHRTNQSFHRSLGEDGEHPEYIINPYSDSEGDRIYPMYDTVHLFKNIYYNLLNKKHLVCPPFPGSEAPMNAMLTHLVQVFNMEQGAEAKMAFKLTDKVIHPTNFERVNVQLAISATHETTTAALDYFGQQDKHSAFKQTAEFLRLMRKWFDVVNVKSASVNSRLNDPIRKPITNEEKGGLDFLEKFSQMMATWLDSTHVAQGHQNVR